MTTPKRHLVRHVTSVFYHLIEPVKTAFSVEAPSGAGVGYQRRLSGGHGHGTATASNHAAEEEEEREEGGQGWR